MDNVTYIKTENATYAQLLAARELLAAQGPRKAAALARFDESLARVKPLMEGTNKTLGEVCK